MTRARAGWPGSSATISERPSMRDRLRGRGRHRGRERELLSAHVAAASEVGRRDEVEEVVLLAVADADRGGERGSSARRTRARRRRSCATCRSTRPRARRGRRRRSAVRPQTPGTHDVHARDAQAQVGVAVDRGVAHEAARAVAAQRVLRLFERARAEAALAERGRLHVGVGAEHLLAAGAQPRASGGRRAGGSR